MNIKRDRRSEKTRSVEYIAWGGMKTRCYNKNCDKFHLYGGRGIVVCDRWLDSFDNFLLDMGRRPANKTSLDRIDSNGNYCPENCQWVTQKEQCRNKRNNHLITFKGETHPLSYWCEKYELSYHRVKHRLNCGGWSIEDAFFKVAEARVTSGKHSITINGQTKCLKDWYKEFNTKVTYDGVRKRLTLGWSLEDALTKPPRRVI